MNVFEYTMQMEREGELFYRKMAEEADDPGLKRIFTILADDEVKHYEIFRALKDAQSPEMARSLIIEQSKTIFEQIRDSGRMQWNFTASQADQYRLAQDVEAKARDFYQEKAADMPDGLGKQLLLRISDEEDRHYHLLGNMIQFIEQPNLWLENAEFHHLDEY